MKNLEVFINPSTGLKALYIISRSGHRIIDIEKILFCKADRNYTKIISEGQPEIIIPKSLCVLESIIKRIQFFALQLFLSDKLK
ncbi:MAG TPA: hypothetical protein VHO50_14610 [Bacteroidales bacterium]|nr:hypothetical protein [Bacteroidales bacterium]